MHESAEVKPQRAEQVLGGRRWVGGIGVGGKCGLCGRGDLQRENSSSALAPRHECMKVRRLSRRDESKYLGGREWVGGIGVGGKCDLCGRGDLERENSSGIWRSSTSVNNTFVSELRFDPGMSV